MAKVCVIILNYNGWADTLECLESLLLSTYHNFQIVVVDNASTDNSLSYFQKWAAGRLSVLANTDSPLQGFSRPPFAKPLSFVVYTEPELAKNGFDEGREPAEIIFIKAKRNQGYAAGNNIGLKWALQAGMFSFFWILNNDTVVPSETLRRLLSYAESSQTAITGVLLRNYSIPQEVQSYGGHVNKFWGTSRPILNPENIKDKLDYVEGAAFLISKNCLEVCGLLPEEYFLYFEEVDYCFKAREKKMTLGIALDAVVFHKEKSFQGNNVGVPVKTEFRDFQSLVSRVRFSKRFLQNRFGLRLGLFLSMLNRIKRMQFRLAWKIITRLLFRRSASC